MNKASIVDRFPTKRMAVVAVVGLFLLSALWFRNNSLGFRTGLLPSASDPYLDNSGRVYQSGSYYLGNALRTTGRTYGIKLGRLYVTAWTTHINPNVSPSDAHE